MGGGLAISTVTVRLEAGSNQDCWAPVVVRRERSGGVVEVEDGCRSRSRWSVCWELTMVGVAGNDGRRSQKWGAFRGESIPCQYPCHVTSSLKVGGPSSAATQQQHWQQAARPGKGGSGDKELCGCCCTSPVAQALQGHKQGGGRKHLTPPSSSSTHAATAARRTPSYSLQCVEVLDNFTSSPPTKRCSVLFLVTVLLIISPKLHSPVSFQDDDPASTEEYSHPGHQPQLLS